MLPDRGFKIQRIALHIATGVLLLASIAWAAGNERVLHRFSGYKDGGFPVGGIVIDDEGDIYGTNEYGGAYGFGNVFLLAHKEGGWQERVLYSFGFYEGCEPYAGVVFDSAGNLYGTTSIAGAYGGGNVFMLSPHRGGSWTKTVLHEFGGFDGELPQSPLVIDAGGNLYGTTSSGGQFNGGVVFELSPSKQGWVETVLHNFSKGADGAYPYAGVTLDGAGNLYGTNLHYGDTTCDPPFGCGTVFKLTHKKAGWEFSVLYTFTGGEDGGIPFAGITLDAAGNLYGATSVGGTYDLGIVFKLAHKRSGWKETVLHSFAGGKDGAVPYAETLVFDSEGNLYGTTVRGGNVDQVCHSYSGCGVVFELSLAPGGGQWREKVLHRFNWHDGALPYPGVVFNKQGHLLGVTDTSDGPEAGLIFEIEP